VAVNKSNIDGNHSFCLLSPHYWPIW